MDHTCCTCPHTATGVRLWASRDCPQHGEWTGAPRVAWALTLTDREFLRCNRIDPETDEER